MFSWLLGCREIIPRQLQQNKPPLSLNQNSNTSFLHYESFLMAWQHFKPHITKKNREDLRKRQEVIKTEVFEWAQSRTTVLSFKISNCKATLKIEMSWVIFTSKLNGKAFCRNFHCELCDTVSNFFVLVHLFSINLSLAISVG